ncbi:MAG: PAS domain S-box protein [Desulfomicrobium sp.]|nr:PAS domain S-box protein [Desulfomicrobium sp.]
MSRIKIDGKHAALSLACSLFFLFLAVLPAAGVSAAPAQLVVHDAVHKGNAEALAVVQDRIPDVKKAAIADDWYGRLVLVSMPWSLIASGIGFLSLALLGVFLWNFSLRRRVREKTAELEASVHEVRDSAEKYRLLIEHQTDLVVKVDLAGRFLYVSPAYCRVFGKAEGELLNSTFMPLIHPDDLASTEEAMQALFIPPHTAYMEQRAMTVDGWRWLAWNDSAILGPGGEIEAIVGVGRDISERKEAEERLRQSEEKFSRLFKLSPDAISLSEPDSGLLVEVNDAYAKLTGYEQTELVGRSSLELGLFVNPDGRRRVVERLKTAGQVTNMEVEVRRKDGAHVQCSVSCQFITIGQERFLLAVMRDVTEFKRMQEMMVQSEKMVSVGGIAAGIAHEINNPLGIIVQTAQTLVQRTRPDFSRNIEVAESIGLDMTLLEKYMQARKILPFVQDMQAAAVRAADIIRHMLDFSRRSESRRAVCALPVIVDRALTLAQNDYDLKKSFDFKRIGIVKEYASDLTPIECTETELEQVFLNLLRNAAQAMSLVASSMGDPTIVIRLLNSPFGVRCEVEDNGPGMPTEIRRRVFEPFYTTKPPGIGTGLGLSVSYFIVIRGHGGKMWVESTPGAGARFIMELPVTEAQGEKEPDVVPE